MSTTIFVAKWESECADHTCPLPIRPGHLATYIDDELVHEDCIPRVVVPPKPSDVCGTCWTIQPCFCVGE